MVEVIVRLAMALIRENIRRFSLSLIALLLCSFLAIFMLSTFERLKTEPSAFLQEIERGDLWICLENQGNLDEVVHNTLQKVRTIKGVSEASSLYELKTIWQKKGGEQEECLVIGIDPTSDLGLPKIDSPQIKALKQEKTLLVSSKLFKGTKSPKKYQVHFPEGAMHVGGTFEGSGQGAPRFYTNSSEIQNLFTSTSKGRGFILIKGKNQSELASLQKTIEESLHLPTILAKDLEKALFKADLQEFPLKADMNLFINLSLVFALALVGILLTHLVSLGKQEMQAIRLCGARKRSLIAIVFVVIATLSISSSLTALFLYQGAALALDFLPPIPWKTSLCAIALLLSLALPQIFYPLLTRKEISYDNH